ncbi:MAG: lysophospholipid acyltransferase family protein [Bacteroidia bacterium]|nr:lysophospholipid acyltransferase family protein [Bacteroidia bacterium]
MDIIKSLIVWLIGICFLLILFPLTFLVWLLVLPFDRERSVTHWLLVYQGLILWHLIPIWRTKIEGREKAVRGTTYVIISNHQSILDILLINCLRYKFKWLSKIENVKVPVLGWYLRMADYITVDRGNEESKTEMLEKSYSCLKRRISVMIFPEGTRSMDKEIGFYKRGAFQLAIQADVPILPVLIDGTGGILPKHGLVFGSGHQISIRVLDPILPVSFLTANPDELAQRISSMMKKELAEFRSKRDSL